MDDMLSDPEELTVEAGLELQPVTWRLVDLWRHTIKDAKGRVIMLKNSTLYAFKSPHDPFTLTTLLKPQILQTPSGTERQAIERGCNVLQDQGDHVLRVSCRRVSHVPL